MSTTSLFASADKTSSVDLTEQMAAPSEHEGSYKKDVATGVIEFIPSPSINMLSSETEGYSPGYDPDAGTSSSTISPNAIIGTVIE